MSTESLAGSRYKRLVSPREAAYRLVADDLKARLTQRKAELKRLEDALFLYEICGADEFRDRISVPEFE